VASSFASYADAGVAFRVGAESAGGCQPRATPWLLRIISPARPEGARGIHIPQGFTNSNSMKVISGTERFSSAPTGRGSLLVARASRPRLIAGGTPAP
jgi:hypothetical protein